MDKFFTAFPHGRLAPCTFFKICKPLLSALLILSLVVSADRAAGQAPTLYESFDSTPAGEVPEGWNWYSLGGAFGNNWVRATYGFFGPKVMTSGVEYALPGQVDEDWLVTPQITPAAGDHLIFDAGQEFVWDDWGSTFHILISTASANRADFTATLATWTEPEFPGYLYEERLMLDLSAYEGIPIHIAFVHKNPVTGEGGDPDLPPPPAENWYLDNVTVRPVQPLDYSGAEIFGSYTNVIRLAQSKTSVIISLIVRAAGDNGTANISKMTFTSAGTSDAVHIKKATLYTTYGDSFIATDDDNGIVWADEYGSVTDPGSEFTIEGNQDLQRGDTYFWLMFEMEADEADLIYPYPQVDATFEKVVVNGVAHDTTVPTTEGSHAVVPDVPVNDHYADAIELAPSATPTRYGSYNYKATYEAEIDRLAYCATPIYGSAMDGSNSVWWHFHAPGEGKITVDLSACNFNTLLLIQDINRDQLACNKDIDEEAFVFQSRITDFPVEAGKDYYIRVTGEGQYPGDPNSGSGVVHMDFTFMTPLRTETDLPYELSALYPNPTTGVVYTDLQLRKPGEVILDVVDLLGQPVLTLQEGFLPAGKHEALPVNVSSLPNGTYMIRVRGSVGGNAHKLVILR